MHHVTVCLGSAGFVHAMCDNLPRGLRGLGLHQDWLLELSLLVCCWALHWIRPAVIAVIIPSVGRKERSPLVGMLYKRPDRNQRGP